jgi:hypothetical protein
MGSVWFTTARFVIAVMSTSISEHGVTIFTNSVFLLPGKYWVKKGINEGNEKRKYICCQVPQNGSETVRTRGYEHGVTLLVTVHC